MNPTWRSEDAPEFPATTPGGWLRGTVRGLLLALVLLIGVLATLIARVIEVPFAQAARPLSGWITVAVCRCALALLALRVTTTGQPMRGPGAYVANHSSWLDIFVLNAGTPLYFVSKAEVADWPGIGWLARLTGTVFVRRNPREADTQRALLEERISAGQRLLFFPEGTSTDGQRVLPFKPTLFSALTGRLHDANVQVQPVTVAYHAPDGVDARFYGWWGDMAFGPHLMAMLASSRSGHVDVTWHTPIRVSDVGDRKALARAAEGAVRSAHPFGAAEP